MTAFTVVRFQAKPGHADTFEQTFRSLKRDMTGLKRFVLIKTGDHAYCSIGEWEAFDHIVQARPAMKGNLDQMRPLLAAFSEDLGVTDAVSGEVVFDAGASLVSGR